MIGGSLFCSPTFVGLRRIASVLANVRIPRIASQRNVASFGERVSAHCSETQVVALAGTAYFRAFAPGFPRSANVGDLDLVAPGWLTRERLLFGSDLASIVEASGHLVSLKWIGINDASGRELHSLKVTCHHRVGLPVSVVFLPHAWYAQQLVEYQAAAKLSLSHFQAFARLKREGGHAPAYNSLGIKTNSQRQLPSS